MIRMYRLFFLMISFVVLKSHKHSDKPMVLLISFDGFRWDYLLKHNLTNFNSIKNNGSHAQFIKNAFSTVTFPNHWTLVTGHYEESHGIIQNAMYDPVLNKTFNYINRDAFTIEWFGQNKFVEPIWATNQKAGDGRNSAAEWLGSNVVFNDQKIISIEYNHTKPNKQLIDEFINLFTAEINPINFGAMYFDEPDHTGHLYGPYSEQMNQKLKELDEDLGYLIDQLKSHHLYDKINLIITSDHGMESISEKTVIFLEEHVDTNLFNAYGSRACYSIFLKNVSNANLVIDKLKKIQNIDVYRKNEIPDQLKYKVNSRIGEIVIVAHIGYAIYVNKIPIDWNLTNGDHGYYNNETSMYPIFIAHGPAFKKKYKAEVFNSVDIYPLMCFILGIQPALNNGSLEHVINMVTFEVSKQDLRQSFVFVLLLLIPGVLIAMTGIFVFFTMKNTPRGVIMTEYDESRSENDVFDYEEDVDDRTRLI